MNIDYMAASPEKRPSLYLKAVFERYFSEMLFQMAIADGVSDGYFRLSVDDE